MSPRKLAVMCIDDKEDNQAALREYKYLFEISAVSGMGDTCRAIIAERNNDKPRDPVDIFLVDVDMSDNPQDHDGYDFGGGRTGLMPYGPVLGLPYLSVRATTQFVPYSEHWDDPAISDNGFVLLALSFLMTAIEGKQFTLSETKKAVSDRKISAKYPNVAIKAGLVNFRKTICAKSEMRHLVPHNVGLLIDELDELAETAESFSFPLKRAEDGKELALEWVNSSDETSEALSLHSVFADLFDFKTSISSHEVRQIGRELNKLAPFSVDRRIFTDREVAAAAFDVLTKCIRECENINVLKTFTESHDFVKKQNGNIFQLRRSVMLIGWVLAWRQRVFSHETHEPDVKKTWDDLFLRRDEDGKGGAEHWHPAFLAKRRCVSGELYRTPFQVANPVVSSEAFVKESYRLSRDAPALLTAADREICRIFARELLHKFLAESYAPDGGPYAPWTGEQPYPYPRWMTASVSAPFDWNRQYADS